MTERSGALQEDALYMSYAQIAAKSCGEEEEEGGDDEGGEDGEGGASIHVSSDAINYGYNCSNLLVRYIHVFSLHSHYCYNYWC